VPQPYEVKVTALPEVVQERLILRAHSVQVVTQDRPGDLDPFQNQHFELAEVTETLVLEVQPRVYEELIINKEMVDRVETVGAMLRHQEAEVVVEDAAATSTLPIRDLSEI
jgi:hypothetical protein